jgi:16S rRNA (cytosine(1402)-N(4))-methyltransferase
LTAHVPVLTAEVLDWLQPQRGGLFVDCTLGMGGHAKALLEAGASRLIGLDRDPEALAEARTVLAPWHDRVELVHADYRDLEAVDTIYAYGEERYSRRIARAIVRARAEQPIDTTGRLAAIVRRAVPRRGPLRIDAATRTFQALRIWVNRELEGLDTFLRTAIGRLRAGTRLVVISFHSLEDRIVKHTLRALAGDRPLIQVLTKKPIVPSDDELARNPRARSAKLRAAERI